MTPTSRFHWTLSPRYAAPLAVAALVVLWGWVYGRFAGQLYFVFDDWIETEAALARPLGQLVRDSFSGALAWSGYRPLTYIARGIQAHLFGIQSATPYFLIGLGLHLANTLLTFHLVRRVTPGRRGVAWAFVAAAVVLLLPSHNEAVLYISASANLFALFFCLLALEAALTARARGSAWAQAGAVAAYGAALLFYEVTLALPLLVLAADWALGRDGVGHRWPMYAGFAAVALLALALRVWAGGAATTARADYGLTLNPIDIARGYTILLGQMILLHTSAWPHVPLYSNVRDWMAPANPRALASIFLACAAAAGVFVLALRGGERQAARRGAPFWMLWGVAWLLLMGLPFAALAGRLPENRYTTIPSFGLAVAVAAAVAWLYDRLGSRMRMLAGAAAVALLAFYAYVDTSDVAEWERASSHARAFLDGMAAEMPLAAPAATIAQVGVPGNVGAAYVFTTADSFASAVRLRTAGISTRTLAGDFALSEALAAGNSQDTFLFGYDSQTHTTRRIDRAWLCSTSDECEAVGFAQPDPTSTEPPWGYIQVYEPQELSSGGLGMLVAGEPPALRGCWAFIDLTIVIFDPSTYDDAVTAARCAQMLADLQAGGALTETAP